MPTGYTAAIRDGITFKTYAMNCARAFGACIELRDEPAGGDAIPERFEPSTYHANAAAKDRADLAALDAMTLADKERGAAKEYDDTETSRVMYLREKEATRAAYEAMLVQVNAWAAPTGEHENFKKFMREQIEQSIKFDCDSRLYSTPPERKTGPQWAAERQVLLAKSLARHEHEYAEEVKRADSRTAWVAALRSSLADQH